MEPGWEGEAGKGRKPGFCGKRIELSHREGVWEWEWEGRVGTPVQYQQWLAQVLGAALTCPPSKTILSVSFRILLLPWALF